MPKELTFAVPVEADRLESYAPRIRSFVVEKPLSQPAIPPGHF